MLCRPRAPMAKLSHQFIYDGTKRHLLDPNVTTEQGVYRNRWFNAKVNHD
ncbi:hypothetical protein OK016_01175 [Vibrio chagasii]|nr:hypothetical protein [Vibrio chagasii]